MQGFRASPWLVSFCAVLAPAFGIGLAAAEQAASQMDHSHHHHAEAAAAVPEADPHAAHRHMMEKQSDPDVQRIQRAYAIPELSLVREDGRSVRLADELNDGRPVVMNFIYTTCTTICPVTSQVLSVFQQKLGADRAKVHIVSISIDPEEDTPARLRDYGKRFHAGPTWQHYTGTLKASVQVQQAFGVYRGDKTNHAPVTLVRPAPGKDWVRLEGFATPEQIHAEIRGALLANR
ncbi:MAG: hypothetical protein RLZZ393_840 [Pseudomonadota bacterium]